MVEPLLIGRGVGVSPVALLVSAMYWAWLWGLPGLLLSTPLTACLKVAGDYIPELGFFAILLGAENVLEVIGIQLLRTTWIVFRNEFS